MAKGMELAPLLTKIKVDIKSFKNEMEEAGVVGKKEAAKISENLSAVTKVGDRLASAGEKLTTHLSVPLLGAAVASGKMAVDFETSFAKVSTLLDENIVDFGEYKDELLEASNDTKIAVDEFSESVYESISAGVEQTKAIGFTTEAMKLAKGGFTDGAKAVDVLTTAINGYNLQTEDASRISDLLITTQNLGKTTVDELASSMGTVIPVANSVNFEIEELSASYAQLTKNGIATAEAGTYLKAMLSELGKSGSITDETLRSLTGKSFTQLKAEGMATADILRLLSGEAQKNDKTLKDMFGSVEAGSAALVLTKGDGAEYSEMLRGMERSAGATQAAFDKMDATPAERMAGAVNQLKNEAIKMGELLVPVVEKGADKVSELADSFAELSDEERENIVRMGAVLIAAGPAMTLAGKAVTTVTSLTSTVGGLTKAVGEQGLTAGISGFMGSALPVAGILAGVGASMYAVHESAEFMNKTILDSADDMSMIETAWSKMLGVTVYTKEELQELGYVHKDFSENISKEFQKAVEDSAKTLQDFGIFLHDINFDGVMDESESMEFRSKVDGICQGAIDAINARKEEANKGMADMFLLDDGTISESEQKVLDYLGRSYDTNTSKITELKNEIYRIEAEANEKYGRLRDEDIEDINGYLTEIKRLELESIGSTQEEILFAKNEFANRVETLDLASASKLLQEKASIRDEEIIQIKAAYDTQIELLRQNAAEATGEDKKALEEQIRAHTQARDEQITKQNELYDSYIGIIEQKKPELIGQINTMNGEIYSNMDRACNENLEAVTKQFNAIGQVSESGMYRMYNHVSGRNEDVFVNFDDTNKKVVGLYNETAGTTSGLTEDIALDTARMAGDFEESYRLIDDAQIAYVDEAGNVYDVTGENIGHMDDLGVSVDSATGMIRAMNKTPIKIESNADEAKQKVDDLRGSIDSIDRNVNVRINVSTGYSGGGPSTFRGFSNYNGLDYVPYDGYSATLHKGERVLTEKENRAYSEGGAQIDYDRLAKVLKGAVSGMGVYYDSREIGRVIDDASGRR